LRRWCACATTRRDPAPGTSSTSVELGLIDESPSAGRDRQVDRPHQRDFGHGARSASTSRPSSRQSEFMHSFAQRSRRPVFPPLHDRGDRRRLRRQEPFPGRDPADLPKARGRDFDRRFGIGYSSLSALADITADEIKIDRSFITTSINAAQPGNSARDRIAERALGMTVIAEDWKPSRNSPTCRPPPISLCAGLLFRAADLPRGTQAGVPLASEARVSWQPSGAGKPPGYARGERYRR